MRYRFVLDRGQLVGLIAGLALLGALLFLGGLLWGVQLGRQLVAESAAGGNPTAAAPKISAEDEAAPSAPVEGPPEESPSEESPPPEDDGPAASPPSLTPAQGELELSFTGLQPIPATPYGELIYRVARRHSVNPELVAAVAWVESAFEPRARSVRNARGLLQVLPETAKRFGVLEEELDEPEPNLDAGIAYLAWLAERFHGDPRLVLAAYNAGEAAVEEHGGVPPFRETREYVNRVYALFGVAAVETVVPMGTE